MTRRTQTHAARLAATVGEEEKDRHTLGSLLTEGHAKALPLEQEAAPEAAEEPVETASCWKLVQLMVPKVGSSHV